MPASKTLLGTIYFAMNSTELKSNVNKTFIKLNWTLLAMCAAADWQLSHRYKIVLFAKLGNGLISTVYPKMFTLDAWALNAPHSNYPDVVIASYNLYKMSSLKSRVIIRQL